MTYLTNYEIAPTEGANVPTSVRERRQDFTSNIQTIVRVSCGLFPQDVCISLKYSLNIFHLCPLIFFPSFFFIAFSTRKILQNVPLFLREFIAGVLKPMCANIALCTPTFDTQTQLFSPMQTCACCLLEIDAILFGGKRRNGQMARSFR